MVVHFSGVAPPSPGAGEAHPKLGTRGRVRYTGCSSRIRPTVSLFLIPYRLARRRSAIYNVHVATSLLSRLRSFADSIRAAKDKPEHLIRGERGEKLAAAHLRKNGYKILTRRYRPKSGRGDIDLVAREKDVLVFIEVKARGSEEFGRPIDAVNNEKRRHLRRAALDYLRRLGNPKLYFRFDVVEVVLDESGKKAVEIRLVRNVFDLGERYRY